MQEEVIKMADKDFFDKPEGKIEEPEGKIEEPEKIKLGEEEYTQEELDKLVKLGKIGAEAEEKYNVKIDKVWPNFQSIRNEKQELEKQLEDFKQTATKDKIETGKELTPEEVARQERQEAKKLGLISIEDVNEYIDRRLEAREMQGDVQSVVSEAEEKYGIKTSEEAIVNYMIDSKVSNPLNAFKLMYEEQIDAWKEQQINKAKKPGMVTESTSSAGTKQPTNEPVTKDNFFNRVDEVLDRQS